MTKQEAKLQAIGEGMTAHLDLWIRRLVRTGKAKRKDSIETALEGGGALCAAWDFDKPGTILPYKLNWSIDT